MRVKLSTKLALMLSLSPYNIKVLHISELVVLYEMFALGNVVHAGAQPEQHLLECDQKWQVEVLQY